MMGCWLLGAVWLGWARLWVCPVRLNCFALVWYGGVGVMGGRILYIVADVSGSNVRYGYLERGGAIDR